jgi:hypothetical protein
VRELGSDCTRSPHFGDLDQPTTRIDFAVAAIDPCSTAAGVIIGGLREGFPSNQKECHEPGDRS